jgi:hypothetical protein
MTSASTSAPVTRYTLKVPWRYPFLGLIPLDSFFDSRDT